MTQNSLLYCIAEQSGGEAAPNSYRQSGQLDRVLTTNRERVLAMTSIQPGNKNSGKSARALMVAVLGIATAVLGLGSSIFSPPATQIASGQQSCVNGIVPLNPYVINCNLPSRGNQIVGAAPDAGAIIGCRHNLACLALYVNYPGSLLVPGYQP